MEINQPAFDGRTALIARLSYFITVALLFLFASAVQAAPPPMGIAPVISPAGGFAIDGDLLANTPAAGAGDWLLSTNAGSGGSVLDASGNPLNPATTFHFRDLYGSTSDNTFVGGLKWTDNPNIWQWTTAKASSKTDINNVLFHTATDTNGHTWVIVAADRASTSGDSYIDFEFLQHTLVANSNGTFTSTGPDGGRTANDLLLSLAFTGGGSTADFFAWRWLTNSAGGGFMYVDSTASLPVGRVFVAANSNAVAVPYGAFGQTTYTPMAFAEAAVDLTELLGNFDPCVSLGFKTIMIKTKTSAASTASISDMINPVQYTLNVGPSANAGPNQARCTEGDVTKFTLNGSATPGLQPISSTTWSLVSGSASIDATNSLVTTAYVSSASATLRLTVIESNGCTETSDVVLTVYPLPTCAINGVPQVCPKSQTQFSAPAGMGTYSWSISGNGVISGATNAQIVTVAAGTTCSQNFTLQLNVTSNNCPASCSTDVLVNDTAPPTLTIPPDRVLECPANTGTNVTGVAVAQDNCSQVTVSYSDSVSNICGGASVTFRTWTAVDLCGNSTNAVQTITVQDTTKPVITCPPNRTLECPADISPNATGLATATDSCNVVIITFSDSVSNTCGGGQVISRTWTATDACANRASCVQTITVRDTTKPVITCPPDLVLECPADTSTNATGVATATDTCSQVTVTYSDSVSNSCSGTSVTLRTWTATDACNNSITCVQKITVRDTTKPTVTCPTDLVLDCPADTTTNATGVATATDTCSQVTIRYTDAVTNNCSGTKFIARTWTATDACGNAASCVQKITVRDITGPSITCPPDLVLECPANTTTNATGVATATDTCSQVTIRYTDSVTNNCGGTKVIARTWTATDACGNSSSCVQTITVVDTTRPSLICPTNVTLDCPADTRTNVTGVATAQDGCGTVTVSYQDAVTTNCGPTKVIARTWTATDACGNTTNCVQTITVRDITKPVITCPPSLTLECPADTSTNATGIATATDTCSQVTITYSDSVSNNCGVTKVIARTWTATDACGNSASCVQTIAVRDTTKPTLTCPPDLVLECPANTSTNATGVATATDTCNQVTVTYSDSVSNGCSGTSVILRTWTATDACNNSISCVQKITVRDTTKPTITCPPDLVLDCPANTTTNATGVATAQDTCSQVSIGYSDAVTNNCSGTKFIARTWTATDACGNSSSCVQRITVRDITGPSITCPSDLVLECPANTTTNATGVATATDTCSQVTIRYADSVTNNCGGTKVIARTWTATDGCGNSSSCVQTITVVDTTRPSLICPTNVTLDCPADTRTNVTGAATAQDGCGSVTVTYQDAVTTNCGPTKVIARTWTATDACGNTTNCVQTITVRDITKPTITCPPSVTLECPADTSTNATGVATATDTCSQVTITYSDSVSNNCGATKVIARTWTATDACGNSASCVQTITVRDTTKPVITCPPDLVLECPANTTTNATGVATATDTCNQVTVTYTDSVSNGCSGTSVILRTWTAMDACNNSSSCVQKITVRDTTKPTIHCPGDLVLECPADTSTNATGVATASDTCSQVTIRYADSVTNNCGGTKVIARTWIATDACGNSSSCVQTITVRDTTKPTLTIPTNVVLECPATNTGTNATGTASAQDGCGSVTISYSDSVTTNCGPTKVIARTWTATDACGNSVSGVQTITVRDTTKPTITCPPDVVLECPANTTTNATGVATAQDTCSQVTIRYSDSTAITCGNAKVISRTWTATDACGNSSSCVQTITVRDTTSPTITRPPDLVLECGASTSPSATGTATAQDSCSAVTVTYSDSVSNNCGGSGVIRRTWTATDQCGNSASALQTITLVDTTPPSLRLPANLTLQCPGDTRTNVTGVPVVSDVCSSFTVTYSDVVSNSCGLTKTVWRTWTAVDACGNSTNGLQTITVVDTTKPTFSCPKISVQCVDDVPAPYSDLAAFLSAGGTATDSCSSPLSFMQVSDSGLVGRCPGTVTRVYRVTDVCGNSADCTQTITVDDTIPPVLTCPPNLTVECGTSLDPATIGGATATDNCSTNISITYTDSPLTSQYSLGFYVADADTNTGPFAPTYLKFAPGSLPCPDSARLTGRALDPLRNAVAYAWNGQLDALTSIGNVPTAFGQIVPYEVVIQANGGPGPEHGTIDFTATWATYTTSNNRFGYDTNYMVYCAFVDAADPGSIDPNNNARVESYSSTVINPGTIDEAIQGTFRVSGLDSGDRVVVEIWVVLDSSMPDHGTGGTVNASLVSAQTVANPPVQITVGNQTDSLGNLGKIFPMPPPQQQPPLGPLPQQPPTLPGATMSVINRSWSATDDCGNQSTCVQQITVRDTTGPVITAPDLVLDCPADTSTNATGVALAQDACTSVMLLSYSDVVSNGCGGAQVVSRTWTAVDSNGNTNSAVQTITVRNPAPILTCPPDLVLECPADTGTNATGVAVAQDACNPATVSYSDTLSNVCGGATITLRTWTATDACGTSTSCVQTIVLRDTTPPTITCHPSRTVGATNSWTFDDPSVSDTCSTVTLQVLSTVTNSPTPNTLSATRTWLAADACGNTNTCQQTITVLLGQLPIITSFSPSQVVPQGSDLTLSVTVSSQTPCTYTWQLGGVAIPGASGTTCVFHNIQLTNAGVYSVIVSNAAGAVGSPAAVIDVAAKIFYQWINNRWTLLWSSPYILQAAPVLTGPWADVPGATSPYVPTFSLPHQFFRLRSPLITFTTNYSGGQYTLSGANVPGYNFIFQTSTNGTDWSNLQTNPAPVLFIDGNAWQYPNRTYRAVMAQPIVDPPAQVSSSLSISLTPKHLSGGAFSLNSPGVPGYSFVVQASTDLVHWVNLQTNLSPIAFSDPNASQYPKRFYRALLAQ